VLGGAWSARLVAGICIQVLLRVHSESFLTSGKHFPTWWIAHPPASRSRGGSSVEEVDAKANELRRIS